MIQIHKAITLTPGHPTNQGMTAYKNFSNGKRLALANDNRFLPIATGQDQFTWEPLYALRSSVYTATDRNGVPGVFGESFNAELAPHQIITNGVVDMPTDRHFAIPSSDSDWNPGAILVLTKDPLGGWEIGKIEPVTSATPGDVVNFSNQQIGVLLEKIEWRTIRGLRQASKPTVSVLVGYSKIPKKLANPNTVKAAPLATPKVATK